MTTYCALFLSYVLRLYLFQVQQNKQNYIDEGKYSDTSFSQANTYTH